MSIFKCKLCKGDVEFVNQDNQLKEIICKSCGFSNSKKNETEVVYIRKK